MATAKKSTRKSAKKTAPEVEPEVAARNRENAAARIAGKADTHDANPDVSDGQFRAARGTPDRTPAGRRTRRLPERGVRRHQARAERRADEGRLETILDQHFDSQP
jgi:hypothetical protein